MNECCKKEVSAIASNLADTAETLLKMADKRQSVMQEAAYRRAEIIVDVLAQIKDFVSKR
jgi:hypothetical protein